MSDLTFTPIYPDPAELEQYVYDNMFGTDNSGWCIRCGDWTHDSCEPDARNYHCEVCETPNVFSAMEIVFMTGQGI